MTTQAEYNQQLADLALKYCDKAKPYVEIHKEISPKGGLYIEPRLKMNPFIRVDTFWDGTELDIAIARLIISGNGGIQIYRRIIDYRGVMDIGPTLRIISQGVREAFIKEYQAKNGGKLRKSEASYAPACDDFQVEGELSDIVDIAFNTIIQNTAILSPP